MLNLEKAETLAMNRISDGVKERLVYLDIYVDFLKTIRDCRSQAHSFQTQKEYTNYVCTQTDYFLTHTMPQTIRSRIEETRKKMEKLEQQMAEKRVKILEMVSEQIRLELELDEN